VNAVESVAEKLQSLLSDEEGLSRLQMLYDILSENHEKDCSENNSEPSCSDMNDDENDNNCCEQDGDFDFSSIMKLQGLFNMEGREDKNTALLIALKPHLSLEKQEKVDKAVKIMNILEAVSVLKETGLLGDII
jgi:hypothetical protein